MELTNDVSGTAALASTVGNYLAGSTSPPPPPAHTCAYPSTVQPVTDTIVNPVPPNGTLENLTTTITSNPAVGFPVTACGYCCLSTNAASCPTDAYSPLFVPCTSTAGPVYFVPDLLAYNNQAAGKVGLGMSISNGGPPALNNYNDYEIGARRGRC